jgi:hypothetical protein
MTILSPGCFGILAVMLDKLQTRGQPDKTVSSQGAIWSSMEAIPDGDRVLSFRGPGADHCAGYSRNILETTI